MKESYAPGLPSIPGLAVTRLIPLAPALDQPNKPSQITAAPFQWRAEAEIPKREFVFGPHLIRKFVSGTAAPGGVGKSFLAQAEALSMVSGVPFLKTESTCERLNVWYWNLEDPADEIERRFAAAYQFHKLKRDDFTGKLYVNSGRDTPLVIAKKDKDAVMIMEPIVDDLIREIKTKDIDVVVIDPFISSHAVPENDNMAIDRVVKLWGKVADAGNCAVELIHHTRKMNGEAMSEESFRGAKSLVDGLRSARVLHPMSEQDASNLGLSDERRRFFHVMPEKQSMAPPAEKRSWFKLNSVELANGDNVAAVSSWHPPDPFEGLSTAHLEQVQRLFRKGSYRTSEQAAEWGGIAVAEVLELDVGAGLRAQERTPRQRADRGKVKSILRTWERNGAVGREIRKDEKRREEKEFYTVP